MSITANDLRWWLDLQRETLAACQLRMAGTMLAAANDSPLLKPVRAFCRRSAIALATRALDDLKAIEKASTPRPLSDFEVRPSRPWPTRAASEPMSRDAVAGEVSATVSGHIPPEGGNL